jgi:hypothetical protein
MTRHRAWPVTVLLVASLAAGCTKLYAIRVGPNSHHVPPDATVRELGPAKASFTHGFSVLFLPDPDLKTSELERRAFDLALRQQVGASVLLNYGLSARIRGVPLIVSWGEIDVEGTGAQILPPARSGAPAAP